MSMLVSLIGAKTVVEVGTFTGMSALWLARGLRDGGRLICFDITDEYLATATEAGRRPGSPTASSSGSGPPPTDWRHFPPSRTSTWRSSTPTRAATDLPRRAAPAAGRARRDPRRQRAVERPHHRRRRRRRQHRGTPGLQRRRGGPVRLRGRDACRSATGSPSSAARPTRRHPTDPGSVPRSSAHAQQPGVQHGNHGFDQGTVRRETRKRSRTASTRVPMSSATRPARTPTRCRRAPTWRRTPSTSSRSEPARIVDRVRS